MKTFEEFLKEQNFVLKNHFSGKLGSGSRFKNCKKKMAEKGTKNPAAVCAAIGRAKFGAKRFQKMAVIRFQAIKSWSTSDLVLSLNVYTQFLR